MSLLLQTAHKAVDQFSRTDDLKFRCLNDSHAKLLTIFMNRALHAHQAHPRYPKFEFRVNVLYVNCTHKIYDPNTFKMALNIIAASLIKWRPACPEELVYNQQRLAFQNAPWSEKPVVYITDSNYSFFLERFFTELSAIYPVRDLNKVVSFFPNKNQTVMVGIQTQVDIMIKLFEAVIGKPVPL